MPKRDSGGARPPKPPKPPKPVSGYTPQGETAIAPAQQQKAGNNRVQRAVKTQTNPFDVTAVHAGYQTASGKSVLGKPGYKNNNNTPVETSGKGAFTQGGKYAGGGGHGGGGRDNGTGSKAGAGGRPGGGRAIGGLPGGGGGGSTGGGRGIISGDKTTLGLPHYGRPQGSSGYDINFDRPFGGDRQTGVPQDFGPGAEGGGGGGGGAAGANPIAGGSSLQGLTVEDAIQFGAKETKKQRLKSKGIVKTRTY